MQSKNKNKVVIACAGSGKTYGLCKEVIDNLTTTDKRILMVTYTNNGANSLRKEYQKQNSDTISSNVDIKTWYQFLSSDMIKPYQTYITQKENLIKSFEFYEKKSTNFDKIGTLERYINKNLNIKKDVASELAIHINTLSQGASIKRLEEIYSKILIDEIQDLAGYDLNLLELFFDSQADILCVGDYKQATYATHNSQKNKMFKGSKIISFFREKSQNKNLILEFNNVTLRCEANIAAFANSLIPNNPNPMTSNKKSNELGDGVFLIGKNDVEKYIKSQHPTVLCYNNAKQHQFHPTYNFGESKGSTYSRVLIYPTETSLPFLKGKPLKGEYCKYYVAVTRAEKSVAIVVPSLYEKGRFSFNGKFEIKKLNIDGTVIEIAKYRNKQYAQQILI
jgi:superfamily I DNA/RNA helicase